VLVLLCILKQQLQQVIFVHKLGLSILCLVLPRKAH
jgi:hypothetical protein